MKQNKTKKAFTLVELLVVIAIIAILAVVSIVGYTAFTKKARDSVAKQELEQFVNILIADDMDNDNFEIANDGLKVTITLEDDSSNKATFTASNWIKDNLIVDENIKEDVAVLKGDFTVAIEEEEVTGLSVDGKYVYAFTITSITYTLSDGGTATHEFVAA